MRFTVILALAAGLLGTPAMAAPLGGILDEVTVGVLKHDVSFANGIEKGMDINAELLFVSPMPLDWGSSMPQWLRWVMRPQPNVGVLANTAGATSQIYSSLTWTITLSRDVFRSDDPLVFRYSFGGAVNNGYANSPVSDRKNLGSNLLFRLGFEFGYQVTPRVAVYALWDHESNGGLAAHNRALNNLGLRVGYRF